MSNSRLLLWRRVIYLFDETNRAHWRGPFSTAGYRWPFPGHPPYIIGRRVLDRDGHDLTPDIVTSSSKHWAVLEVTLFPESKVEKAEKYARINPGSLSTYGLSCPDAEPDVIVVRLEPADDGQLPQLILGPLLHVERPEGVKDALLREALMAVEGADLLRIPEIPIAFLPESRGSELRQGLVDLVMELFRPERPEASAAGLADRGLERLAVCVSIEDKKLLIDRIGKELLTLVRGASAPLSDDLEFTNGMYRAKAGVTWHPKTLERMKRGLEAWAKGGSTGRTAALDERW